ncbi:hypothetical protein [Mucilaginibacter xinganensis]|uniref:Uncharacterized protein n=1 Tax=Mucilaginibacter xinganensis TaxID=1234841 RepID=A0A223P0B9_9SPHI|nr:hypothetical protein [Mucilaginibacter xinganensis]ASU35281.1 hypothetical protein MuYL_3396 [Mucilaginibacter xinganensis]
MTQKKLLTSYLDKCLRGLFGGMRIPWRRWQLGDSAEDFFTDNLFEALTYNVCHKIISIKTLY